MLSIKEQGFINVAIEEAQQSNCFMMHGCVAVLNGKIIGRGFNHHRCHTCDGFMNDQCTCHAEISALRKAYQNMGGSSIKIPKYIKTKLLKNIILYVVRIDTNNNLKNSAPCVDCMSVIQKLGIKRMVYSDDNNTFQKVKPTHYTIHYVTMSRKINQKTKKCSFSDINPILRLSTQSSGYNC